VLKDLLQRAVPSISKPLALSVSGEGAGSGVLRCHGEVSSEEGGRADTVMGVLPF